MNYEHIKTILISLYLFNSDTGHQYSDSACNKNLHSFPTYLQQTVDFSESSSLQPHRIQITSQYSSSTDEGCETDHGGDIDEFPVTSIMEPIYRLNSYASSSSSSGVVTNFPSKIFSQNLSCDSSRSNFSTFESLDLNLSDCSDLAGSLPSCATNVPHACNDGIENKNIFRRDCMYIYLKLVFSLLRKILLQTCIFFAARRQPLNTATLYPSVYVSMSSKSPCSFSRHNPLGGNQRHSLKGVYRAVNNSPLDFR